MNTQAVKNSWIWQGACAFLLGVLCFLMLKAEVLQPHAPSIVTVDVRSMTHAYIQQITAQQMTRQAAQEKTKEFSDTLQRALQDYSTQHHVVLMPQEAVIEGAPDVTQAICKKIHLIKACW